MKTHRLFLPFCRALAAAFVICLTPKSGAQVPAPDFDIGLSSSELFPPLTGTYDLIGPIQGPPGAPIMGFSIRFPDMTQPPPTDTPSVFTFGTTLRMLLASADGRGQDVSVPAIVSVRVAPVGAAGGIRVFDTEMLQLDAASSAPDFLLRESPTLPSRGRLRMESLPGGTFRITSFFDIFTEVSLDRGQTWTPTATSSRATLNGPAENSFASNALPPAAGKYAGSGIAFANGVVLRKLALIEPEQSQAPPPPGGQQIHSAIAKLKGEVSLDGGTTFTEFEGAAPLAFSVRSLLDSGSTRFFDTEMLSLNFSSGQVMLRESPTRASTGRTSIRMAADGSYRIASFFDVFTELSLDGGQNWSPATGAPCVFALPVPPANPEYFFPSDCFPVAAAYETALDSDTDFGNGIVIRNVRYRAGAAPQPLPGAGQQQMRSLGGRIELELSRDGGETFAYFYKPVFRDVLVTNLGVGGGGGTDYPMETLSLNFTIEADGAPTVMVRESPTLASPGKTSVRSVDGGFMISSFFDIFTEVSVDGGQTWTPAGGAMHAYLLPYIEQDNVFRSDFYPPRDGSYATRRHAEPLHFPDGPLIRDIRFEDFKSTAPLPATGSRLMEEEGIFYFFMSTDGGLTWQEHSAPALGTATVNGDPGLPDTFSCEMNQLDVSGGTLPAGVMIRESPTRKSLGRIGQEVVVESFRVQSFFDIWTELSVDGGQTWTPASAAAHLELHAKPTPVFVPSDWGPLAVQYRETDFNFAGFFPNVAMIRGMSWSVPTGTRHPLPPPGESQVQNLATTAAFELSTDGGATWQPHSAPASGSARVAIPNPGWPESEMLQFDIAGGTLPPGVMIRESPTRASTGRMMNAVVDGGFRISSFFDVFTEISFDGGMTWTAACGPLRMGAVESPREHTFTSDLQPPAGVLRTPSGAMALACATGQHIKEGRITRSSRIGVHPPDPGTTQTVADTAAAEFLFSTDKGQTFEPVRAQAYFRYELKEVLVSGYQVTFDTEMLQFDITGGTLPEGVMLRESPTRASTGRTSLQDNGALDGTYRISSFFDVFVELSTDGGGTWEPMDLPLRLELENAPVVNFATTAAHPPVGVLTSPQAGPDLVFANGDALRRIEIFRPVPGTDSLPAAGEKKTYDEEDLTRIELVLPGPEPVPLDVPAEIRVEVTPVLLEDTIRLYDAEIIFFSIAGDPMPPGVMIRESPTLRSTGRMTVERRPTGTFRISSFFDVFTEISVDGGTTWSPSDGPLRLTLTPPEPPTIVAHPESQRVLPGADVRFDVVATGTPPLSYQWLYKGRALPGATGASLLLPAVQVAQSGHYSAIVMGPGGTVVSAGAELLVVRKPFTFAAGNYNSLILPAPGAEAVLENIGLLKLKLLRTGGFTATLQFAGLTHRLRGSFDPGGNFHAMIERAGLAPLSVDLHIDLAEALDLTNPSAVITGAFADGTFSSQLSAERIRFVDPDNPFQAAGRYTVLVQSDVTQASGYASMNVTAGGAVTIAGLFVNRASFSYGGFLTRDGALPLFVSLGAGDLFGSSKAGSISGTVLFRDKPLVSDCDARLAWTRVFQGAGGFPYAINTRADFIGSRYVPPPRGTRVLNFANTTGNAEVTLGFTSLNPFVPGLLTRILTLRTTNTITVVNPGAEQLKMSIATQTGLFTGSFIHPVTGKSKIFAGAVLQKQNLGAGLFEDPSGLPGIPSGTGFVEFGPH